MKLAIDLGGTNIRIAQIENGKIVGKRSIACPSRESEEEVLSQLVALIDSVMNDQVCGIGIGVPSVVDSEKGIVYNAMNIPSWKEVPLKTFLQDRFALPVSVNNDSNCFALGEKLFGEGIPFCNMVGVTLGTGVGAGVIINNELYSGQNTGAGEIGSLPYLDLDFEHYCSSVFFINHYNVTAKEMAERAAQGDFVALGIWQMFGGHLGHLMKAILFSYDPDAIIIGGGIASAFPFYEKAMAGSMSDFPYANTLKKLQIRVSRKADISMLGVSALV